MTKLNFNPSAVPTACDCPSCDTEYWALRDLDEPEPEPKKIPTTSEWRKREPRVWDKPRTNGVGLDRFDPACDAAADASTKLTEPVNKVDSAPEPEAASASSEATPDPDAIRAHVAMVHKLAAGIDGWLMVCAFGENPNLIDPKTGKMGKKPRR